MTERRDQINDRSLLGYSILLGLYISTYILGIPLANKFIAFGPISFVGGLIAASISYPCTDIVTEVYGRKYAKNMVNCGVIALIIAMLLIKLESSLPGAYYWETELEYNTIFAQSFRLSIAAIITFITSQFLDIYIFAKVRNLTGGKHLWLRNNISTGISKAVDVAVFMIIGFWGTMTLPELWEASWGTYVAYLAIAILDTPLVYLGVWAIRKHSPELKTINEGEK